MRDDSKRWAPPRDRSEVIEADGLTIKAVAVDRLTLLSGPRALKQTDLPLVDWPGVATRESYALSIRRDRVLEVNGPARADGWDGEQSLAISDVTDGYTQIEISGPNALSLLQRGTEIDLRTPSRSTARLLFGLGVFLYRISDENTYRVHVASAQDEALWHALKGASEHVQ